MDMLISTSNAIELPEAAAPARDHAVPTDHEVKDRIVRAINELQATMDAAILAGLTVEPSFVRIENRLAQCELRIDSFVCKVHLYRRLTRSISPVRKEKLDEMDQASGQVVKDVADSFCDDAVFTVADACGG